MVQSLEDRRLLSAVQAASADGFVDSIGINTHFGFQSSTDTTNAYLESVNPDLPGIMGATGIRHIRDYFGSDHIGRADNLYHDFGIDVQVSTGSGTHKPIDQIMTALQRPWAAGVEGYNEPDNAGWSPPGDALSPRNFNGTREWQQTLWDSVKSNVATADLPVLAAPMGDVSFSGFERGAAFDTANIHMYIRSNPGSYSMQSNYLQSAANMMAPGGPTMPIVVTEEGYSTGAWSSGEERPVSVAAQAKYVPRLLADNFQAGIQRTYIYNLINNYGGTGYDNGLGLINYDETDKPAMTDLRNMIDMLGEASWNVGTQSWTNPASGFSPGTLDYTLGGNSAGVSQLLLEKSDGTFYLMLWKETSSFNSTTGADVTVPASTVRVNLNKSALAASVYSLDSTSPTATFADTGSIPVSVADSIVIVKISPEGYQVPASVNFTANFNSNAVGSFPAGWTPGTGDTWQVKQVGSTGDHYVQNLNASGTHSLTSPLGATVTSSFILDFDEGWQFGGNSTVPYGNYSLTNGIDILNSSNNGYRVLLHQGNSNSTTHDGSITQIFKVTGGVVGGTALASGPGYNLAGSGTTPAWNHVRLARDATSGALQVLEDVDGDGEFNVVATVNDASYTSFSKMAVVVGNVNTSEGARFDNIAMATPTVTVATTDATASEIAGDNGYFVISRTGSTATALVVNYELGGSATPGTDLPLAQLGTATIAAGSTSVTIPIVPTNDGNVEGDEHVSLRLLEGAAYHVGQARSGDVRIVDQAPDLVVTGVTWNPANPVDGDAVQFSVTVQNIGTAATPAGQTISAGIRFNNNGSTSTYASTATPLAAGAWVTLTTPNYTVSGGNRTLRAIVDSGDVSPTGAIAETNGANNVIYSYMQIALSRVAQNFTGATSLPAGWLASGNGWQISSVGSQTFLENNTTNTGTRSIAIPLGTTHTSSWALNFDYTWRWGGTTGSDGSSSLGSFTDVLDSSGTGYRIRFRQGNGGNAANNSSLTQVYAMSGGTQGALLASGTGFNLKGWQSLGLSAPNWRPAQVLFDRGSHRLTVLGDLAGSGTYTQLLSFTDLSGPTTFTQFVLGADNLINTVDPEWDDIRMDLLI